MRQDCTPALISLYCTSNSAMLHFNFKMSVRQTDQEFSGTRVALGVTGGIAAYKAIEILRGLQRAGCEVRVTMTKHACEFVQPLTFRALSGAYVLVDDYAAAATAVNQTRYGLSSSIFTSDANTAFREIGRASCRERVLPTV